MIRIVGALCFSESFFAHILFTVDPGEMLAFVLKEFLVYCLVYSLIFCHSFFKMDYEGVFRDGFCNGIGGHIIIYEDGSAEDVRKVIPCTKNTNYGVVFGLETGRAVAVLPLAPLFLH